MVAVVVAVVVVVVAVVAVVVAVVINTVIADLWLTSEQDFRLPDLCPHYCVDLC